MDTKHKTISSQSAEVIKYYNGLSQPCFTFSEVASLLSDLTTDALKKLMRDMVKRGLLFRLKDGSTGLFPTNRTPVIIFQTGI